MIVVQLSHWIFRQTEEARVTPLPTKLVKYDGKDGSVLENKNSNDAIFKYDGNNTVVSCLGFLTACKYNINLESTSIAMCDLV